MTIVCGDTIALRSADSWDDAWIGLFEKYQADLRHAHYLRALVPESIRTICELGAGSFRDSAQLLSWGYDLTATDFSSYAVDKARRLWPQYQSRFAVLDCFDLATAHAPATQDVVFHNGLLALFDNDDEVRRLLSQQLVVAGGTAYCTVHNAHNPDFLAYCRAKAEQEALFRIRFFSVGEVRAVAASLNCTVDIVGVGKAYRADEDVLIRNGAGRQEVRSALLSERNRNDLHRSERLFCAFHRRP